MKNNLEGLQNICLRRCIKPGNFNKVNNNYLHSFSESSQKRLWTEQILRLVDVYGQMQCTLLKGKAPVIRKKFMSIPRL